MRFLGNIDEGKDIITQDRLKEEAIKSYPIYGLFSEDAVLTNEQKAANKAAFDAYSDAADANFPDGEPIFYPAEANMTFNIINAGQVDDNGKIDYIEMYFELPFSTNEAVHTLFALSSNLHSDGSIDTPSIVDGSSYTTTMTDALLAAKQALLKSGTNIKTINGQSILGGGDLVIKEGEDIDLSGYVTNDELIAEVGEAYYIYLDTQTDEQKAHNLSVMDIYNQSGGSVIVYPYGGTRADRLYIITYYSEDQFMEANITFKMTVNVDAYEGEAALIVNGKVLSDGSVVMDETYGEMELATKDYVKDMTGDAYPIYTPAGETELTDEQKLINKAAYDACVEQWDIGTMPYLYLADVGKQFAGIVLDVSVDEGFALVYFNITAYPMYFSDFGLPSGTGSGLATLSFAYGIGSDGSVITVSENYYLAPDISAYRSFFLNKQDKLVSGTNIKTINGQSLLGSGDVTIQAGNSGITSESDPVFTASAAAKITDANITAWNNKVDKVSGKGLSTNDYTTTEKDKLAGIAEGAEVNVQSDWNATSGDAFIKNKPTIPAAVTESTVSGWGFTKNTGTYSKPSTGIPKSDLASSVQTSLGKADTALQSYTEQYKGTVTGVKVNDSIKSPSNGVVDLGTIPTTIDTSMSDTSTNPVRNKTIKAYVDSKAATAGQMPTLAHGYNDTSVEITPNVYHRWTYTMSSLTITLQSVSSAYVLNYMFEFTASISGCVLTLPTNIKWANGNPPAIKPNVTYQISIVNNLGVWTYYE